MEGPAGSRPGQIIAATESGTDGESAVAALSSLPRWHVYREERDTPADSPWRLGREVAIREGDENDPAKWVRLSLGRHWLSGDRYFDELMEESHISATDLLMIASDILQHHGNLPRLSEGMELMSFEGDGPQVSVEVPPPIPPPPRQCPAPVRRTGRTCLSQTPQQRAASDAYAAALENGVRPGDPPPKPFPDDAGYAPRPGEHKEAFRCEGGVFYGYKHACIDWQRMRDGEKWEKKLSAWTARHFDPGNVAMSHEDWTTLCQVLSAIIGYTGCLAAVASCGAADTMTFGTITIPCYWIINVICGGHAAAGSVLAGQCDKLMGMR